MAEVLYWLRCRTWGIAKQVVKSSKRGRTAGSKCYAIRNSSEALASCRDYDVEFESPLPKSVRKSEGLILDSEQWLDRSVLDDLQTQHLKSGPYSRKQREAAVDRYFELRKKREEAALAYDKLVQQENAAMRRAVVVNGKVAVTRRGELWDPCTNGTKLFYLRRNRGAR